MQEGKEYTYIYKPEENPRERLKNKIQSLFVIVDLLKGKKSLKDRAEKDKEDIRKLLTDLDTEYENHRFI